MDAVIGGIMLCKRPLPGKKILKKKGSRSSSKMIAANSSSKANVAKKSENLYWKPCGGSTNIPEKAKVVTRISKNDGALRRHKQWLKQMQEQKEERARSREDEERLKEEKKRDFMVKQAKKRTRIREQETTQCDEDSGNCSVDGHEERHNPNAFIGNSIAGEKRSRPAWSLTEADADHVSKSLEAQEESDLMNYVDDLDFDSIYDDMELKVLMSQVKDRIRVIEREKNVDESKLRVVMESEIASIRSEKFNTPDFLFDKKDMMDNKSVTFNQCDDLQSIAETIRSQSDASVSTIHSRKSLQMLVYKEKERLLHGKLEPIPEFFDNKGAELGIELPFTITHKEDDGERLKQTKSLNKLPFKNRNPAL